MITIYTFLAKEKWNFLSDYYIYQLDNYWPAIFFTITLYIRKFNPFQIICCHTDLQFWIECYSCRKMIRRKKNENYNININGQNENSNSLNSQGNEQVSERKIEKTIRKPNLNYIGQDGNSDVALFIVAKYDETRFEARKERVQKKIMERFYLTAEIIIPKDISDDSVDEESKEKERKFKESYMQKIINFLGEVPYQGEDHQYYQKNYKNKGTHLFLHDDRMISLGVILGAFNFATFYFNENIIALNNQKLIISKHNSLFLGVTKQMETVIKIIIHIKCCLKEYQEKLQLQVQIIYHTKLSTFSFIANADLIEIAEQNPQNQTI